MQLVFTSRTHFNMFGFFKRKRGASSVVLFRMEYIKLLNSIRERLLASAHWDQARFIEELISLLTNSRFEDFIANINGAAMWGGAGSVWEVEMGDVELKTIFMTDIVKLINLMDKNNILGYGILPIKKLFTKEIRALRN